MEHWNYVILSTHVNACINILCKNSFFCLLTNHKKGKLLKTTIAYYNLVVNIYSTNKHVDWFFYFIFFKFRIMFDVQELEILWTSNIFTSKVNRFAEYSRWIDKTAYRKSELCLAKMIKKTASRNAALQETASRMAFG